MTTRNANDCLETSTRTRARIFAAKKLAYGALALVAATFVGACFNPSNGESERGPDMVFVLPDSDVSATLRDADDNFVSELNAVHTVGGTDCPQALSTVTVDNESDEPAIATLEVLADPPVAIDIAPAMVEVPAGGSAEISVAFNCMSTDDIDTTMDLSLEVGGRVGLFEIPLILDVMM